MLQHSTLYRCLIILLPYVLMGQTSQISNETVSTYFQEAKAATALHRDLWGKDLYGPLILVDPKTRQLFANESDTLGILTKSGDIYTGIVPTSINIANTAFRWGGKVWTMVMLPLSVNYQSRIHLITHELFHKAQPALGFFAHNPSNPHLETKNGRMYLRLELLALLRATQTVSRDSTQIYLAHALAFRQYRNDLFPGSDSTENLLEMNEGLAEYTGFIHSDRNEAQAQEYFARVIKNFMKNPTFSRSFAYQTIPAYGYVLWKHQKDWNKKIVPQSNLIGLWRKFFSIPIPLNLKQKIGEFAQHYNGATIEAEEIETEQKIKRQMEEYTTKFIRQPHCEITLEKMNFSFDPGNVVALGNSGTVYPTLRITDVWGVLSVEGTGGLINSSWNKVSITLPTKIEGSVITGEGWTLKLDNRYTLTKDETTGHYTVIKK